MEKDKSTVPSGNLLPPSGRYSGFSLQNGNFEVKMEPQGSSKFTPVDSSRSYSHDISQMPDNPPKHSGHRRAHSEILTLPDDISFDSDLGVVGGLDGPSYSDDTEEDLLSMYLDLDKFNSSSATSANQAAGKEMTTPVGEMIPASVTAQATENVSPGLSERPTRIRHHHSQSMDGSSTIKQEMLLGPEETSAGGAKKSMSAAKLSELALVDPKRAKRILANRQSAARSKERKMRYIAELERKLQTLQTEATSLSAQLALLQRDTNGLSVENSELKLRLQTTEQQVHLQDALNDALKDEIQHLKILTGQALANGGQMMNFAAPPPAIVPPFGSNSQPFYPQNNNKNTAASMHSLLTAQQFQQLQIHSQKQQHQFQQQQLLQFQQQQLQQLQQKQEQQSGDLKVRGGPLPTTTQKENSSDINPHSSVPKIDERNEIGRGFP